MFKLANATIAQASKSVATGAGKKADAASAEAGSPSIMESVIGFLTEYKLYLLLAAAGFVVWKWVLPMLGIGKKRRGNPGSLAKARRARAAKRGKM